MFMRRPTLVIVAAVVAVAVLAVGFKFLTRDRTDPRIAWAAAADTACIDAVTADVELGIPDDLNDETAVREWAAAAAAVQTKLAADLAAIDTPNGDVEALAKVAIDAAARRAEIFTEMAAEGSELPNLETGEWGPAEEFDATYTTVEAALSQWGGVACGNRLADVAVESPQLRWLEAAEAACLISHDEFAAAEASADDTAEHLRGVADVAARLADQLRAAGEPAEAALVDGYNQLLAHIDAAVAAAVAGDVAAVRAANDAWTGTAALLELPSCARGITGDPENPSNLIAAEVVPAVDGVADGAVTDAAGVAGFVVPQLMSGARPDPADAYSTRGLIAQILPGVTGVPGSEPATATAVSISERRLPNPGGEPAESNPWVVGVAVSDTSGNCVWSQVFGIDRLYGYTPSQPATGPCTGDAAAAAYVP